MSSELAASAARLKESNIVIAMLADGRERICINDSPPMKEAIRMGAAIWTPEEMLRFIEMGREERDVFRTLKQTFQGSGEFKV